MPAFMLSVTSLKKSGNTASILFTVEYWVNFLYIGRARAIRTATRFSRPNNCGMPEKNIMFITNITIPMAIAIMLNSVWVRTFFFLLNLNGNFSFFFPNIFSPINTNN